MCHRPLLPLLLSGKPQLRFEERDLLLRVTSSSDVLLFSTGLPQTGGSCSPAPVHVGAGAGVLGG